MARAGLFDHPIAIDDLTEDDVLGWENAGIGTLRDFIDAGNAGIVFHRGLCRDLVAVADEASHSHLVPDGGSGVFAAESAKGNGFSRFYLSLRPWRSCSSHWGCGHSGAAYTGARFGELTALDLDHFEPLRRCIRIERTMSEVRGKIQLGETKTRAAKRTVTLPAWLVEALAVHLANFPPNGTRPAVHGSRGWPPAAPFGPASGSQP